MVLNKDFREFIGLLNAKNVKYLVIGGYAVAFHGHPRYTKDIDFWIWLNEENAKNMLDVLESFGMKSLGLTIDDFLDEEMVLQLGYPPNRIDILMGLHGLTFETCYTHKSVSIIDGLAVNFIDIDNLIKAKLNAGRLQDKADVKKLKEQKKKNK